MKLLAKILVVASIVSFYSCDNNEEESITEMMTQLDIDIPITSENSDHENDVKSTIKHDFTFSGSEKYEFEDIANLNHGGNNFYGIRPLEGTILSIPGIGLLDDVNSLTLTWHLISLNNLELDMDESVDLLSLSHTFTDGVLKINLDDVSTKLLKEIRNPHVSVQFSISGKSVFSLESIANLHIPVAVESITDSPVIGIF